MQNWFIQLLNSIAKSGIFKAVYSWLVSCPGSIKLGYNNLNLTYLQILGDVLWKW